MATSNLLFCNILPGIHSIKGLKCHLYFIFMVLDVNNIVGFLKLFYVWEKTLWMLVSGMDSYGGRASKKNKRSSVKLFQNFIYFNSWTKYCIRRINHYWSIIWNYYKINEQILCPLPNFIFSPKWKTLGN